MARYFLHVFNRIGAARDDEGAELDGLDQAIDHARQGIRSIIADEARTGRIDLDGRVEIASADGTILAVVPFPDAFALILPAERVSEG
ncbi:MAG TPA: hypothetical protein VMG08_15130 [Allosphingosinicella sp.]|nr:hypothetical protein [Allosphingosinicella sp.]